MSNSTSGYIPKELEMGIQTSTVTQIFLSSVSTIVKRLKPPKYPLNRWTDKQMVEYSSNNILLGNKKELKTYAHSNTDEACLC